MSAQSQQQKTPTQSENSLSEHIEDCQHKITP